MSGKHWYHWGTIQEYLKANSKPNERGCWEWQRSLQTGGYGQARYKGKSYLAHRLSWEIFKGPIEKRKRICVCHKCDNPICINPDHLFLGTCRVNFHDAILKGRHSGHWPDYATKKNRKRKLSDADVRGIRSSPEPLKVLAERYNTTTANISMIRRGKRKKMVV